jgi:hypothetical protein
MNLLSILIPSLIFYLGYKEKTKNKKYLYFIGAVIVLICMNKNILENFSVDPASVPAPAGNDNAAYRENNGHLEKIFKFKNSSNNYFYLGRIDDNMWAPTNVYTKSYIAPFYNYEGILYSENQGGGPRTDWLDSYNKYFQAATDPSSPAYGGNPTVPVVISFGTADSTVSGTEKSTIRPTQESEPGIEQYTDNLRGKNNIFCSKTKDLSDPAVDWDREDIGRVVWKEGALDILNDAARAITYDSTIDLFDCQDVSVAEMVEEQVGSGQGSNVSRDGSCTTSANCSDGKKCYIGKCRDPSDLEREVEEGITTMFKNYVDNCKSSLVDDCLLVDTECGPNAVEGDQEINGKCNRPNSIPSDDGPTCPYGIKKMVPNNDESTKEALQNVPICFYEFKGIDNLIINTPYIIIVIVVILGIIALARQFNFFKRGGGGSGSAEP